MHYMIIVQKLCEIYFIAFKNHSNNEYMQDINKSEHISVFNRQNQH